MVADGARCLHRPPLRLTFLDTLLWRQQIRSALVTHVSTAAMPKALPAAGSVTESASDRLCRPGWTNPNAALDQSSHVGNDHPVFLWVSFARYT